MELGAFSISLAVEVLQASKNFYEKSGFSVFAGVASQNWLILKNGTHVIGLFQGMLERNTLTFNPGWDGNATKLDMFTDVRDLQPRLRAQGVQFTVETDESTTGSASFRALEPERKAPGPVKRQAEQCDSGKSVDFRADLGYKTTADLQYAFVLLV